MQIQEFSETVLCMFSTVFCGAELGCLEVFFNTLLLLSFSRPYFFLESSLSHCFMRINFNIIVIIVTFCTFVSFWGVEIMFLLFAALYGAKIFFQLFYYYLNLHDFTAL